MHHASILTNNLEVDVFTAFLQTKQQNLINVFFLITKYITFFHCFKLKIQDLPKLPFLVNIVSYKQAFAGCETQCSVASHGQSQNAHARALAQPTGVTISTRTSEQFSTKYQFTTLKHFPADERLKT